MSARSAALALGVLGALLAQPGAAQSLPDLPPFTARALGGPGFDCRRAATAAETLFCADPDLAAADGLMSDIYGALRSGLSPADGRALVQSQREWLQIRTSRCPVFPADLVDPTARARQKGCLLQITNKRAEQLYDLWRRL